MYLNADECRWVDETLEKIKLKMAPVAERNKDKIPYTAVNGVFDDKSAPSDIAWWTNGFWGGIMWQMYDLTGDPLYKEAAENVEEKLDAVLTDPQGLDHDNGFRWLPSAVADYRMTGNKKSYDRGILAADNLAGRFNPAGKFIRAWNDWGEDDHRGWAIIDCMMNLPLLYWASDVTKDPRFREIAVAHADTAMRCFVRDDGSVNHIVEFDPFTGEMNCSYGGQGYETGSSWTRGQSWGLYGFTLSYIHTKDERYLNTARRIAHYFIANIPEDGFIPVDFREPSGNFIEDDTAAAIASCGLIELSKYVPDADASIYLNAAFKMLKALSEERCEWSPDRDELLTKCTAAYHDEEHEFPIIYGDYYFIEAVLKLAGKDLFIW